MNRRGFFSRLMAAFAATKMPLPNPMTDLEVMARNPVVLPKTWDLSEAAREHYLAIERQMLFGEYRMQGTGVIEMLKKHQAELNQAENARIDMINLSLAPRRDHE